MIISSSSKGKNDKNAHNLDNGKARLKGKRMGAARANKAETTKACSPTKNIYIFKYNPAA